MSINPERAAAVLSSPQLKTAIAGGDNSEVGAVLCRLLALELLQGQFIENEKHKAEDLVKTLLDNLPETARYSDPEEKAFLAKKWVTVAEATEFSAGQKSEQTVRNMCSKRTIYSNIDERTSDKDPWMICPRSLALHLNRIEDPRLSSK